MKVSVYLCGSLSRQSLVFEWATALYYLTVVITVTLLLYIKPVLFGVFSFIWYRISYGLKH